MQTWKTRDLVSAGLYKDEQAVVQDAIRALLAERPQLRLELAIPSLLCGRNLVGKSCRIGRGLVGAYA